jgi:aldose 1-epimerase
MADKVFSDSFTFLPQGAIIQEFKVGGRNIAQGFPSAASYKSEHSPFFGETIGRVANRVSGAKIDSLNGKSYALAANNGPNSLHGGVAGWGKRDFEGPIPVQRNGREAVLFKYLSKDGEEGYPGTVELRTWYIAGLVKDEGVEKTSLEIEYEVELVGDEVEETAVAVTNHRYVRIADQRTHMSVLVYLYLRPATSISATSRLWKERKRCCLRTSTKSSMMEPSQQAHSSLTQV